MFFALVTAVGGGAAGDGGGDDGDAVGTCAFSDMLYLLIYQVNSACVCGIYIYY